MRVHVHNIKAVTLDDVILKAVTPDDVHTMGCLHCFSRADTPPQTLQLGSGERLMASGEMNSTEEPTLEPPYSDAPTWMRALHASVAMLLMVVTILGNVLVAVAVAKYKRLQYRSIMASMGTVAVNFMCAMVGPPQVLAGSITGEWPLGDETCTALGYILTSFLYVRWLNCCLIAVDRFLYITFPFFYQRNSKWILVCSTAVVWTVPFVSDLPTLWALGGFTYRSTLTFCAIECEDDRGCVNWYIALFGMYVTIGIVTPTLLYLYLYCLGLKKKREMRRELGTHVANGQPPVLAFRPHSRPSVDLGSIQEEPEMQDVSASPASPPTLPSTLDTIDELKILQTESPLLVEGESPLHETAIEWGPHSPSTADSTQLNGHCPTSPRGSKEEGDREDSLQHSVTSDEKEEPPNNPLSGGRRTSIMAISRAALSYIRPRHRMSMQIRENRARTTFIIIFVSFVVTQIPLYFLAVIRRTSFFSSIPLWVHLVCVNLFLLSPALDPIIIIRNRDFKAALAKMFGRRGSFSLTPAASSVS